MKLPVSFYVRDDVVCIARDLLGKVLCTHIDNQTSKAIITETEAYAGVTDKASHAYGGKRTKRTEPMYAEGGIAYVYLCYGIHHLLNVVTNEAGAPHAILIRAGKPLEGIDTMLQRRGKTTVDKTLLGGPGSLAQALGVTTGLSGTSLVEEEIWLADQEISVKQSAVSVGPRVGIDYAEEDAARPYRFRVDL